MKYTAVDGMGAKRFIAKTEETSTSRLTLFGAHQVDVWGRAVSTSKPIALGVQGPPTDMPPLLEPTQTEFDVRDRPVKVTEPGNRETRVEYGASTHDGLQRLRVSTEDPDGSQTARILDGDQLLGTEELFDNGSRSLTSYHYTVLDELQRGGSRDLPVCGHGL
jgi:YD repeat-containing protein